MGIHDEVEHKKPIEIESREIRGLQNSDLEARELMYRAGNCMRTPMTRLLGVASVFFYQNGPGFEFRTFASLGQVPEAIAQTGVKEFTIKAMEAYGIKAPKDRRN